MFAGAKPAFFIETAPAPPPGAAPPPAGPVPGEGAPVAPGAAGGGGRGGGGGQAVFVTPQSLATFPVAAGVVATIWGLVKAVADSPWAYNKVVPLVAAGVIGGFLTWWGIAEPSTPLDKNQKIGAAFVGVINTIFLAAAAIGVSTTITAGLT